MYENFDNYVEDNGEYIGLLTDISYKRLTIPIIHTRINAKKIKRNLKKFWGLKIGEDIFRINNTSLIKFPLEVIAKKNKIFYLDAEFKIKEKTGWSAVSYSKQNIYFSETLTSKVFYIDKITEEKSNDPRFKELCRCIEVRKQEDYSQNLFNAKFNCIKEYLID